MRGQLERFEFQMSDSGFYEPIAMGPIVDLPDLRPSEDAVQAKIQEFGERYGRLKLPDGNSVGIGVVNADQLENDAKLVVATPNSGNEQNAGHVFAICTQGAVNPNQAIISVDPPRHLSLAERSHLRATGRFSYFDKDKGIYRGLPSFDAIGQVLHLLGYTPKYLSGNHAAVHLGLGIVMGLPENTLLGMYANGPHISKGEHRAGDDEVEDAKGWARRHLEPDKWAANTARQRQVRASLPEIYGGFKHKFNMVGLWAASAAKDLFVYRQAFKHDDLSRPASHASLQDAAAVLLRHQAATMTVQFNEGDRSQSQEDSLAFGQLLASMIDSPRVRLIFGQGNRDSHTDHPKDRWEAEQWAFRH